MRAFIALELDEPVRERLARAADELHTIGFRGTFPKASQLHVTLAFLGEIPDEALPRIRKAMESTPFHAFDFPLSRIDFFPSENYVKTVVARIESAELDALHDTLVERLQLKEEHTFKAHVALARVKGGLEPLQKQGLHAFARAHSEGFGSSRAARLVLKKSTLTPLGPQYEDIASIQVAP